MQSVEFVLIGHFILKITACSRPVIVVIAYYWHVFMKRKYCKLLDLCSSFKSHFCASKFGDTARVKLRAYSTEKGNFISKIVCLLRNVLLTCHRQLAEKVIFRLFVALKTNHNLQEKEQTAEMWTLWTFIFISYKYVKRTHLLKPNCIKVKSEYPEAMNHLPST